MKIKMLAFQAGPSGVREAGRVYDVADTEARELIAGGYAVEAKRQEPVERAARVAPGRRGRVPAAESAQTPPTEADAETPPKE